MTSYDPDSFADAVTDDFNWRIREISDLKQIVKLSGTSYEAIARKAALTLVYAHWEGHVLFVGRTYLDYIAKRKLKFGGLVPSLHAVQLASLIPEWQRQRDTVALRIKMVESVRAIDRQQFKSVPKTAVNTGGNLNYERFSDICRIMTLDAAKIVVDSDFLDKEIVGLRNQIAHGTYVSISDARLTKAADFVIGIMRAFRTDIENCVTKRTFSQMPTAGATPVLSPEAS